MLRAGLEYANKLLHVCWLCHRGDPDIHATTATFAGRVHAKCFYKYLECNRGKQ